MASYGGETPVDVVDVSYSNTVLIYTVPSGKYFKGFLYIDSVSSSGVDIVIDGLGVFSATEKSPYELFCVSGDTIQLSGPASGNSGLLRGLLFNNPS